MHSKSKKMHLKNAHKILCLKPGFYVYVDFDDRYLGFNIE